MPTVNVPGRGLVRFPDTMSREDIAAAIRKMGGQTTAPVAKAEPTPAPTKPASAPDNTSFFPPLSDYPRRMSKFLMSPIKPLAEIGHRAASAIEGIERPREATDFELPESGSDRLKLALGVIASPLLSVARAAQAAPGAVSALASEPRAASRGLLAGITEGAAQLSPLDVAMIGMGLRGRGRAETRAAKAGPPPPPGPGKATATTPTPTSMHVGSTDLGEMARELADRLRQQGARSTGTQFPGASSAGKKTGAGGATRAQTAEEAASKIIAEIQKPGGPKSVASVTPKLQTAPPKAGAEAAPSTGKAPSTPKATELTTKAAGPAKASAAQQRLSMTVETKKAYDALIDKQASILKEATREQRLTEKETRARKLKGTAGETSSEPPVPGTVGAEAYGKGSTPAEVAARRLAQRAAEAEAATGPLPKLKKGKPSKSASSTPPGKLNAQGIRQPTFQESKTPRKAFGAELNAAAVVEDKRALSVRSEEAAAKIIEPPPVEERPVLKSEPSTSMPPERAAAIPGAPEIDERAMRHKFVTPDAEAGRAAVASILGQRIQSFLPESGVLARRIQGGGQKLLTEGEPTPQARALASELERANVEGARTAAEPTAVVSRPGGTSMFPSPSSKIELPKGFRGPGGTESGQSRKGMARSPQIRRALEMRARFMKRFQPELKPEADVQASRGAPTDINAAALPVAPKKNNPVMEAMIRLREKQQARRAAEAAITEVKEVQAKKSTGVPEESWDTMDAVEGEALRLITDHEVYDPRLIDQMRRWWGSKEAARRLGMDEGMVKQISGPPHGQKPLKATMQEMDARYRYLINDPSGFFQTEALAGLLGAAAGGTLGATIGGEDATDKAAYIISGLIMGGYAGMAGVRGLEEAARMMRKGGGAKGRKAQVEAAKEAVTAIDSANLLSGAAPIKASLGSLGGVSMGILEAMMTGNEKGAKAALKYMMKKGPADWFNTLTGPTKNLAGSEKSAYVHNAASKAGIARFSNHVLNQVMRPFIAADRAGTEALKRLGMSKPEAERMMLMGEPTTWQGQSLLRILNSNLVFRLLFKFPRVRIQALERGVEYLPMINKKFTTRHQSVKGERINVQEPLTAKQLSAKAKIGAASMLVGSVYGYYRDPSLAESAIVTSAGGPLQLPLDLSVAAGKSFRHKGEISDALMAAAEAAVGSAPQISDASIRMIPQRFVPLGPLRRALKNLGLTEE